MRKLLAALTLLALIFTGCAKDEGRTTVSDLCVFSQTSDGTPMKTMLSTGKRTAVCIDPLCDHGEDCSLYSCGEWLVCGDEFIFVKGSLSLDRNTGERSGYIDLLAYNMTNGGVTQLDRREDSLILLGAFERYVFFSAAERDDADRSVFRVFRADLKSRKVVTLPFGGFRSDDNDLADSSPRVWTIADRRIYWYAPGEDGYEYFTTDLAGKNKQTLESGEPSLMNGVYKDGFAYFTERVSEKAFSECISQLERLKWINEKRLCRVDLSTGEKTIISENAADYIVTDDVIFFVSVEPEPRGFTKNGETYYDLFGGKVYYSDGVTTGLFSELEYDLSADTFAGARDGYLALRFMEDLPNSYYAGGYEYNTSDRFIIIGTRDGALRLSD